MFSFWVALGSNRLFACAGVSVSGSICKGVTSRASWEPGEALADLEDIGSGGERVGGSLTWVVLRGVSLNCFEQVLDKRITPPTDFSKSDPVHLSALATVSRLAELAWKCLRYRANVREQHWVKDKP